jgi:hypothetical protein
MLTCHLLAICHISPGHLSLAPFSPNRNQRHAMTIKDGEGHRATAPVPLDDGMSLALAGKQITRGNTNCIAVGMAGKMPRRDDECPSVVDAMN